MVKTGSTLYSKGGNWDCQQSLVRILTTWQTNASIYPTGMTDYNPCVLQ